MSFAGPTDAEIRMAMAEWLRGLDDWTGLTDANRRELRKVTGWRDATVVLYPGASCEHERAAVDIFYATWDGEDRIFTWEGELGYLVRLLTEVMERY